MPAAEPILHPPRWLVLWRVEREHPGRTQPGSTGGQVHGVERLVRGQVFQEGWTLHYQSRIPTIAGVVTEDLELRLPLRGYLDSVVTDRRERERGRRETVTNHTNRKGESRTDMHMIRVRNNDKQLEVALELQFASCNSDEGVSDRAHGNTHAGVPHRMERW